MRAGGRRSGWAGGELERLRLGGSGSGQAEDIPTIGLFRWMLPVDP